MREAASAIRLVLTAVEGEEQARELAEGLVRDRLAACVSVLGPAHSYYIWKENLERTCEWLLLIKTVDERLAALHSALAGRHPYTVPEILTLPEIEATSAYAAWARGTLAALPDGTEDGPGVS